MIALAVSIVLHAVLASYRYEAAKPPEKKPEQQERKNSDRDNDGSGEQVKIWFNKGIVPCDYYVGIGVQFMHLTGIVTHVAHDGPAWKAGLRAGDELVTDIWNMDLKFGQTVDLVVKRNGKTLKLKAIVDRICRE